jgi:hypothetical protein
MAGLLSTGELLMDVMDAFKVRFPMLNNFSTDMSADRARFNEQITAHISTLPTVRDYDATTGYKANAASANDLVVQVPVTIDRHKHVPIKVDYIDQISTRRNLYEQAIGNVAFSLGKEAFDYAMSLVVAANFSESSTFAEANSDKEMLDDVTGDLNAVGTNPFGRFGIVNSAVFSTLDNDSRIASGDYYGQRRGASGYGVIRNTAGFEVIYEYPSMPANSENLSAFFGTRESLVIASRLPQDTFDLASSIGIPKIANTETITDPERLPTMQDTAL